LSAIQVTAPIKLMIAVLLGLAVTILIITQMAGTGIFPAAQSTALISTNSNLTNELPVIGAMVGVGLVFAAMSTRRR
jgi:hypothetical protein